jgi:general secretion pathway protein B
MSYILDALKKSEKERQRGAVPNLMTAQDVIVQRKKRPLWPYVLAGALIVNAGVLAWWLTGHSNKPVVPPPSIAVQQLAGKTHDHAASVSDTRSSGRAKKVGTPAGPPEGGSASGSESRAPEARASRDSVTPKNQPSPAKVDLRNAGEGSRSAVKDAKVTSEITPASPPSSPGDRPAPESQSADRPASQKNKMYHLKELPASVQQTLPDFAVSTHLYSSDESSRMVRINGQLLREGQYLTTGLKLEEITEDGAIFSYHGYRFRIGLK